MILFPLAGVVPITKESLSCRKLSNISSASPDHVHHVLSVLIPLQACALKLDLQSMPSGDLLGIPVTCHEGAVRTKEAPRFKESKERSSSMRFISHNEADALWYFESFAEWSSVLGLSCKHLSGFKTEGILAVCVPATYLDAGMIYIEQRDLHF